MSRHGNVLRSFKTLAADITATLGGCCAVLDGEIVCLGPDGKPPLRRFVGADSFICPA